MYSYVLGFKLGLRGDEANRFLEEAVRTWPSRWDSIPGVSGFLLLRGALALGGQLEYQLRVDIETLGTLATIDHVMASGAGGWGETRARWFRARTFAQARVLGFAAGDGGHLNEQGAIHLVAPCGTGETDSCLAAVRGVPGVVSAQVLRPALAAADAQEELWVRMQSLDNLDGLAAAGALATGRAHLFGELREVDGALFAGA
ncbi:hypothetical protein [Streptomyces coffeae]|uniref:Uncharacterized protein n=1 Tax=Streptomyces coffeae TaxID=621382 RepID=A0ABS1NHB7_9ACTN|nr:hypothetical protein [Streptomyces coffeae]MBL1099206.1 hypothetical protein [Streptomyces coffeae]